VTVAISLRHRVLASRASVSQNKYLGFYLKAFVCRDQRKVDTFLVCYNL